jgi:hypothetical protein
MAPSAAAYNGEARYAKGSVLYYCVSPEFTTTRRDTIIEAFERFDAQASALGLNPIISDTDESCDVYVFYYAGGEEGSIMEWGYSSIFDRHVIRVNEDKTFWWFEGPNTCVQPQYGPLCSPFALSTMMHEVGHWLGFGHQGKASDGYQCARGYIFNGTYYGYGTNQVVAACLHYATRVMWFLAADGYYRALDPDTINGINDWYDW